MHTLNLTENQNMVSAVWILKLKILNLAKVYGQNVYERKVMIDEM